MSIAMQSLTVPSSAARAATHLAATERQRDVPSPGHGADRSEDARAPKGRNALVGALNEALAELAAASAGDPASVDGEEPSLSERASKHALHSFMHELFAALRSTDAEGRHGRGFAWGRTSLADLAQRIDALVQRLQGGAAAPAESPPVEPAPETPASAPTPAVAASSDEADVGSAPPVPASDAAPATRSVAVDSNLLSAVSRLLTARDAGDSPGPGTVDGSDSLIALLQRMSQALAGDGVAEVPVAGSLLDATA